jgi:hydroxymethylbilane synthase/uroporphyrinogen III methyltransferase/synthase
MKEKLVIATRGSRLALIQSNIVAEKLKSLGARNNMDIQPELLIIKTKGDIDQTSPLQKIGGDGLFVRAIEQALLDGRADIAVHSAKDLPYKLADGLMIGCNPDAADPRDVLITRKKTPLDLNSWRIDIPPGSPRLANSTQAKMSPPVIGTDSPRRQAEFLRHCPDAVMKPLRGNVPTRIAKLRRGEYDGIILAKAGLDRLSLMDPGTSSIDLTGLHMRVFDPQEMITAPCQGILAVECRDPDNDNSITTIKKGAEGSVRIHDRAILELLSEINDDTAAMRFRTERYLFEFLEADCSAVIGVYADYTSDMELTIHGLFESNRASASGAYSEYKELCDTVRKKIYI